MEELALLCNALETADGDQPMQPAAAALLTDERQIVETELYATQFEFVPSEETPLPAADAVVPAAPINDSTPPTESTTGFGRGRRAPLLKPIQEATVDTSPLAQEIDGEPTSTARPHDMAAERYGPYRVAAVSANEFVRFTVNSCLWYSPAMRHKPLYFEQPNLERYGSHLGGQCEASLEAAAHFVGSTLALPYQVAAQPPSSCVYTLGVYRPGNCNPHFFHVSPLSVKGLAAQGAAVTGLVFLFP